jgi:hypothetical protein
MKIHFQFARNKKASTPPALESPERLALNSSVHFPLRWNGLRSLIWPQIMPEAVSMMGEAYYGTQISHDKGLSRLLSA